MSALAASFDAPEYEDQKFFDIPVKASTKIYAGGMVAIDTSGWALPAADSAGHVVLGRAEADVDNSAGSNGDLYVRVKAGVFRYNNSGSNALTKANVGQTVFVEDDNTVGSSGGTNSVVAGRLTEVDSDGAWVDFRKRSMAPRSVSLTSTNGTAAAASANLANLAAEAEKIGDDVRAIHAALVLQGILK